LSFLRISRSDEVYAICDLFSDGHFVVTFSLKCHLTVGYLYTYYINNNEINTENISKLWDTEQIIEKNGDILKIRI
jgi:uncharacterized membrane protein